MDRMKHETYSDDRYNRRRDDHITTRKMEPQPWRGSSGFGLANILNRSSSTSNTTPKFNLPSLHSYTKPEISLTPQHYEVENQYSSAREQHQPRIIDSSPVRESPSPNSHRVSADDEDTFVKTERTTTGARAENPPLSIRGGRWTADEHERFLEGFRIHGHKWKRVQQVVRTRSVTQVRTHAQKYLLKVAKLKADKKQSSKTADMATITSEKARSSMTTESLESSNTFSSPELGAKTNSPRKSPRRKVRRLDPGNCDSVDQEYIAAAAATLCLLMTQKIDSIFETKQELKMEGNEEEFEPYDCYTQQPAELPVAKSSGSRKRSYMHFITDEQENLSSYEASHSEPSSYNAEGSKLLIIGERGEPDAC